MQQIVKNERMRNGGTTLLAFFCALVLVGCTGKVKHPLFTQLMPDQSGVRFSNDIDETRMPGDALNEFAYMGGGVAVLDVNNDGLKDLFFGGNQVSSRLYLNKGGNHFEDITLSAGVSTDTWISGISVVDINGDGYDDFYLCTYGKSFGKGSHNLLFINRQNNTFKEESQEYGLADSGYCTQAVFMDYDKDGSPDMYLANYLMNRSYSANYLLPRDTSGRSQANDKLFKSSGTKNGHPFFTDVSLAAGIKEDGYGLGVSVCDFNMDGWPDIYVSNDFVSNDDLWLNNKNGTFSNVLEQATRHQSYSSMGCDAADINNDGKFDFATVDMMPENNDRKKQMFSLMNYERYQEERRLGYSPEFSRNMLQLNNGNFKKGNDSLPFFSEIGRLAGISQTDWSWSILFADFNNDGHKDAHITNGIGRDFTNADLISFSQAARPAMTEENFRSTLRRKLIALDRVIIPNYFYLNDGNVTFSDYTDSAGIRKNSMSNGAAYVDLDNDGDLDLVVNNINQEPFLWINNQNSPGQPGTSHSIAFDLKGKGLNSSALGAKVFVYAHGMTQVLEEYPVRGYLSSVDRKLLFGLGNSPGADSVLIYWNNDQVQRLFNLAGDSTYIMIQPPTPTQPPAPIQSTAPNQPAAPIQPAALAKTADTRIFFDVTDSLHLWYKHSEAPFNDFSEQHLLPQKFSQLGPFISTGDINQDGKTDLYIGAGFNSIPSMFVQRTDGTFSGQAFTSGSRFQEDEQSVLFDADGDGDPDLLVTYGDMRYDDTSVYYHPRLYLNDGLGHFSISTDAIPASVKTIAGCVAVADFDSDGYPDVFIGGRVSKQYPSSPSSYLLRNVKGKFTDVTQKMCPALQKPGMITAAQWSDLDHNSHPDLVIAGDYMPLRIFSNQGTRFEEKTQTSGLAGVTGLWRSLVLADVDGDGDTDLIAGNLGLNCEYAVTKDFPMSLFAADLDRNGRIDPVLFYYIKGLDGERNLHPSVNRDQLAMQVPSEKKHFLLHREFARATPEQIFPNRGDVQILTCNETRSCWFENLGNGNFSQHPLPPEAQFSPVNAIICRDFDQDGINDLLIAGNEYQTEVMTGRYDASFGLFLKGFPGKNFKAVSPATSGLKIDGDVKDLKMLTTATGMKIVVAAVNNDSLRVFRVK